MRIKERENQLEKWYNEFKDLPKLSLHDTKKLLQRLDNNETTEFERKSIKDTIITGTLGTIYKYIKKSGLLLLNSSVYGIDDIISASYNVVIEDLENNEFLAFYPTFSHYFGKQFISKMSQKLEISKINSQEVCNLNNNQIAQTLKWYIKERTFENVPSLVDIQEYVTSNFELSEELKLEDVAIIGHLLKQIYLRSFKDENDHVEISENKLSNIMPLLIESVINDQTGPIKTENVESLEEKIQKEMMYSNMTEEIFNYKELTRKQKETLKAYYGLNQEQKSCTEIAEEEGICPAAISGRHVSALKILRKSKRFHKNYRDLY